VVLIASMLAHGAWWLIKGRKELQVVGGGAGWWLEEARWVVNVVGIAIIATSSSSVT